MTEEKDKINILLLAAEDAIKAIAKELLKGVDFIEVNTKADFEKFVEDPPNQIIGIVIAGPGLDGVTPVEIAQSIRMHYESAVIFYYTRKREGFQRKDFIKNGFNDAFLLPFDTEVLKSKIKTALSKISTDVKSFRPVKLIDVQPGSVLNFDVSIFLPANKKYIKYSAAGDELASDRMERLQAHNVKSMFVDESQMGEFYKYSATRLKALGDKNSAVSATERTERLQGAVRDLLSGVFYGSATESTIEEGRRFISDCKEIVKAYIMSDKESDWYKKITDTIGGEADSYSHASRVSTFAALFSIGTQIGKPDELAMAGLFHDLGLSEIPEEILNKPYEEMDEDEKKLFQMFPELSIKIIKERKLIVPQNVQNYILQHKEKFDGSGFPKGSMPPKLRAESQILGIADEFDELTIIKEGQKTMKPHEAIQKMKDSPKFDPQIMAKLESLFPKE